AAGTAIASGKKTKNRYIGVDEKGQEISSIFDRVDSLNWNTGIVTTDHLTGATPSAFYAHVADRDSVQKIASQLLVSGVDIAIGGGSSDFGKTIEANGEWKVASEMIEVLSIKDRQVMHFAS